MFTQEAKGQTKYRAIAHMCSDIPICAFNRQRVYLCRRCRAVRHVRRLESIAKFIYLHLTDSLCWFRCGRQHRGSVDAIRPFDRPMDTNWTNVTKRKLRKNWHSRSVHTCENVRRLDRGKYGKSEYHTRLSVWVKTTLNTFHLPWYCINYRLVSVIVAFIASSSPISESFLVVQRECEIFLF